MRDKEKNFLKKVFESTEINRFNKKAMKIKIIINFDLKNIFDFTNLKRRIKESFNNWRKQFDLKGFEIEFQKKE